MRVRPRDDAWRQHQPYTQPHARRRLRRPRLGVSVSDVTAVDAEVYRLPRVAGAEINFVEAGSPAARAGVQVGDVVIAIDGQPVSDATAPDHRARAPSPSRSRPPDAAPRAEAARHHGRAGRVPAPARRHRMGRRRRGALRRPARLHGRVAHPGARRTTRRPAARRSRRDAGRALERGGPGRPPAPSPAHRERAETVRAARGVILAPRRTIPAARPSNVLPEIA